MTTMKAVVISGDKAVLKEGLPTPQLGENMALVRVKAVAANPTDWKHIDFKIGPQGSILGCDVAGEIAELGPGVDANKWKVGDPVAAVVHGSSIKHPENGAFAEYTRVELPYALKLVKGEQASEDTLPVGPVTTFEAAASLPVSIFTSSVILFDNFGSKLEWEPASPQHDHALLVWGGATSTGLHIVQLARRFNCYKKIVAVASKKNEALVKSFGADEVFDYHDSDVIEQITKAHPDLYHIVDAVCAPQTMTNCFRVIPADDKPVTIVSLAGVRSTEISDEDKKRKPNVKFEDVLLYQVSGTEVPFGSFTLPAKPSVRETAIRFAEVITPKIHDGSIKHIQVKIAHGMGSVPELLDSLRQGKTSGEKLVARL